MEWINGAARWYLCCKISSWIGCCVREYVPLGLPRIDQLSKDLKEKLRGRIKAAYTVPQEHDAYLKKTIDSSTVTQPHSTPIVQEQPNPQPNNQLVLSHTPNGGERWMRVVEHKFRPTIGAVFASLEAGIKFYEVYARACGFTPRKHSTKTLRGGVAHQKFVVCNRQGFRESKPKQRPRTKDDENMGDGSSTASTVTRRVKITRIGCRAYVRFALLHGLDGPAMIDEFSEVHNHRLTSVCNRDLDKISRSLICSEDAYLGQLQFEYLFGLTFRQVKELVNGYENIGATLIDFKNFQRDIKCYIGNYSFFGDAVSFDPTYGTNKYDMVFTPFTAFLDRHGTKRAQIHDHGSMPWHKEGSKAMDQQRYTGRCDDYNGDHSFPELKTELPIEKHGAIIYTHAVFKVFQEEVMAADSCGVDDFETEEHVRIIHVIDAEAGRIFKVRLDLRSTDAVCECKLFERIGLLCRHIVWVYKGKGIGRIPSKYIVDRWLNNTHASNRLDSNGNVIEDAYMATSDNSHLYNVWSEFRQIVGVLKTLPAEHTEELASLLVEFRQNYVLNRLQKTKRWRFCWAAARRLKSLSTLRNKHATRAAEKD
ncbi:protein FAR1-RELATED SEQUENCE 5-like [Silene latifolia]|uniref:protein FAR1-RELATED SEQUENCE 5-like n=1 Tax=Silene latifolia TaxID=37657 RepID=UPI003D76AB48